MNLTRCSNGHFFDADKYASCPHCNGGQPQQPQATAVDPVQKTAPAPSAPIQKTMPSPSVVPQKPEPDKTVDDAQHTISIYSLNYGNGKTEPNNEPVAGWLVCVDGPHLGEDFRIRMGKNFIGRNGNMDIVLSKDSSVSREKHSIVVYEPKSNMFIVQSGDSKELSYLNDKVILSPQELKAYDTIKVGATTLVFVPFCSENFQWSDINKED